MKICEKCRCQNTDTRVFCIDCGATLGEKLSDAQEAIYEQQLDESIEKMYNRNDPLYVSVFDIVVGILALIGCAAAVIFPFFKPAPDFVYGEHPYIWAFVCFAIAALDALLPQLAWSLETWRLNLWADGADDLQPSQLYLIGRRVGNALALGLGIVILLSVLFDQ